jgi:hypothetical protein
VRFILCAHQPCLCARCRKPALLAVASQHWTTTRRPARAAARPGHREASQCTTVTTPPESWGWNSKIWYDYDMVRFRHLRLTCVRGWGFTGDLQKYHSHHASVWKCWRMEAFVAPNNSAMAKCFNHRYTWAVTAAYVFKTSCALSPAPASATNAWHTWEVKSMKNHWNLWVNFHLWATPDSWDSHRHHRHLLTWPRHWCTISSRLQILTKNWHSSTTWHKVLLFTLHFKKFELETMMIHNIYIYLFIYSFIYLFLFLFIFIYIYSYIYI